jgi:hypothetical protein
VWILARGGLAPVPLPGYRKYASRLQKAMLMKEISLALVLCSALAVPAFAQKKDDAKKDAGKVAILANTFLKGQSSGQYLARSQLIGVSVTNKDSQTIGTVDDLIIGSGDRLEGIIMSVGGFLGVGKKEIGVRLSALKVSRADGKLTVSLPNATKEMLNSVEPYQRGGTAGKK